MVYCECFDWSKEHIVIVVDDVLHDRSNELTEIFAYYFSTVTETALHRYYESSFYTSCSISCMVNTNFFFRSVLEHEVVDVIKSLKNSRGLAVDSIPARVLKLISSQIGGHFAHCINFP